MPTNKQENLNSWTRQLSPEALSALDRLMENDLKLRKTATIYPERENILNAVKTTAFDNVKAVIIGQDPYHGPGQAMGLSFSVNKNINLTPSLRNIFDEYETDLGYPKPKTGDLTPWAENGVLMLNSVLTVERGKPFSHGNLGWYDVTQGFIQAILDKNPNPIVFIIWGRKAEEVLKKCDDSHVFNKMAIRSTHPSPFSANTPAGGMRAFIGSRPFSRTNELLINAGAQPINWRLP